MMAAAAPVRAEETKPDYAAARRHFKSGQQLLQTDRYGEAVVEFKQAYEITKDGLVMGKVAEAYARAGDFENALAAMKLYRDSLPEGERGAADSQIKDYEKAFKEGRSKHLVLPGEQVEKAPESSPTEATTPPPVPEQAPRKSRRLWTWVAAGTAGALAISALVLGLNDQSKYDELKDKCANSCEAFQSDIDSVETRAIATDVLWGTAAAAAITATVLYFVEGRSVHKEKEPGSEVEEEVTSRWQLTPVMGGGRYGISAGLRF